MINFNPIFDEVENLDKDKIMEIFKTLISINTTTPPGNTYRSYVDAISPFFKEMDYNLEEVIVPDELIKKIPAPLKGPRINLVAKKKFNQKKDITFCGHMDVVPASNEGAEK